MHFSSKASSDLPRESGLVEEADQKLPICSEILPSGDQSVEQVYVRELQKLEVRKLIVLIVQGACQK
jgi:hypothetical protein